MKTHLPSTPILILTWITVFILDKFLNLTPLLCGRGINLIHPEWYRLITAAFLHSNVVHLAANCLALYFITIYLDGRMSGAAVLGLGVIAGSAANALFAVCFRDADGFLGGSVIVFAIIGLILVEQRLWRDSHPFRLGTWYGNWTVGYAVLANLFSGSFKFLDVSTIVMHALAVAVGAACGIVCHLGGRHVKSRS